MSFSRLKGFKTTCSLIEEELDFWFLLWKSTLGYPSVNTLASLGTRPDGSRINRNGLWPGHSRVVSSGLSSTTVCAPTKMEASSLRHWCTLCLARALEIQKGWAASF